MTTPLSNASEARTSHTPLPWATLLSDSRPPKIVQVGSKQGFVAQMGFCEGDRDKNAEFIVRACNNHYELLDACQQALNSLSDYNERHDVYFGVMDRLKDVIQKATK